MAASQVEFKIRFVEQGVAGVSRTTDFPNTFPSKEVAEYVCQQIVEQHMDGKVPAGHYFEIYSVSPDGVEESYGKWLGKRFAKIGVAAAVGTALGFLLWGLMSSLNDPPHFVLVDFTSWDEWFLETIRAAKKTGIPPEQFPPPARLVETLGEMPTPPWEER